MNVTVDKANPTILSWPAASNISYGETLASSTLTGGSASVSGSFAFTTPLAVPAAGTAAQGVAFTPIDTTNYNTVASTTSVTVEMLRPTVSIWPVASNITYGQTLASSTLTGGSASVPGSFAFSAPLTAPNAGTAAQVVTFTPTDLANYNPIDSAISLTVDKAVPTVSIWPIASSISFGQTLASSTLAGGTASVGGSFAFTTPSIAPGAGTVAQSVTFAPADATNYNPLVSTVDVTVTQAVPVITQWPIASTITYGQTLAASILSGGIVSVPGSFAFTSPGLTPIAGTSSEDVSFVPTDNANYSSLAGLVNVTVNPANYIVTINGDDAGNASNCTPQTTPGHGTDSSCSLRDALLQSAATGGGNITFDVAAFSTATTISLANGSLAVSSGTTIKGATSGSGTSLANLITIDANGASRIFTIGGGVSNASISNLLIQHGNSATGGGGIQNDGSSTLRDLTIADNTTNGSTGGGAIGNSGALVLIGSTISGNSTSGSGGGISNTGALTLKNDTVAENSSSGSGGGIFNSGTLTVSDSTITANHAVTASGGGGIDNVGSGTVTIANAIVSGNTANNIADDFDGNVFTDAGGNVVAMANGGSLNGNSVNLAPLGDYGGPTRTLIPLPGSAAIWPARWRAFLLASTLINAECRISILITRITQIALMRDQSKRIFRWHSPRSRHTRQ